MRLLVVEDDPVLVDGLTRTLRSEGFTVDSVNDGAQADHVLQREEFALTVLDVGLPHLSGLEVLRRLRGRGSKLPVLLLTARDSVADRVLGLDAGADDYLLKPFAMSELLARIRALLRRAHDAAAPRHVIGGLILDTAARRASVDGVAIEFSGREWSVLEFLVAKAGRVVSKDQIIQAIAGWDDELTPNAVEVYVSRLRAKIDSAGVRIRTVRGFGYMLEDPNEHQ
jgi:DNA-binding response OmpR family regulator